MRAIVVGSGWGARAARALASDERIELLAIVGRGSARTRALAASLGVPAIAGLPAALRVYSPELAVIAARQRDHPAMARALLHHGSHVLCSHPVAVSSDEVRSLADFAEARGLILTTDYTLRETELFARARALLIESGRLLRAVVTCPARGFTIGIDLALAFGGKVSRLTAHRSYPAELAARVRANPAAFAPTLVLEHVAGCVTTIVPVPHAEARRAFQVTLSSERARIDIGFPSGGMAITRTGRNASATREVVPPEPSRSSNDTFARPMALRVRRFVDAVCAGSRALALEEELDVRAVWEQAVLMRKADA